MKKQTENLRLDSVVVDKVRKHKKKTGVSITAFAEQAIEEKLSRVNKNKSPKPFL